MEAIASSQSIVQFRWSNFQDINVIDFIPCRYDQVLVYETIRYPISRIPYYFGEPFTELLMDICKIQIPIFFQLRKGE